MANGMVAQRTNLINMGLHALQSGLAQQDQFAKTWLTEKGAKIYRSISLQSREDMQREQVASAVDAGY